MNQFYLLLLLLLLIAVHPDRVSSQDLRETTEMQVETFDADVLVHGTSAPESVWFAPDYNTPISHESTGGCPGGRIGYSGSWNNYWGNFVRLPSQDFTGSDTISLFFDVSHSYASSQTDNWCRFYIHDGNGYHHTVTSILIDGTDVTYDSGINGKGFQFTEERNCASVEVKFDLSTIGNNSNILVYMEAYCNYNNSTAYSVWFDNISLTASGSAPTPPEPDLGADQNLCYYDTPFTLDAGSYESYMWSTGATTQSIEVSSPGTYSVTVTNASGLTGTDELDVTVVPEPQAPSSLIASTDNVCSGGSQTVNLSAIGGSGNNLQWFTSACGGTAIGSGTTLDIAQPAATTSYYARWENTCGVSACETISITVSDPPEAPVSAAVSQEEVCEGGSENISLSVTGGSGNSLEWYTNSCGSTGIGNGNPLSIMQPQSNTTYYARWENACGVTACVSVPVDVLPSADAGIDPAGPFCDNDNSVVLSAAEAGGTWSGNGITDPISGEFDPLSAGPGNHDISYSISGTCGDNDQITITVDTYTEASIQPAGPFCEADPATSLSATNPGGMWSGNGITDSNSGSFDPSTAGPGSHLITYSFNDACGDSDQIIIDVDALTNPVIDAAGPFCETDPALTLSADETGGNWSGPGIINPATGLFDPSAAGTGTHTITYDGGSSCGGSDQLDIEVLEISLPEILSTDTVHCEYDDPVTLEANETGGMWSGAGVPEGSNVFDPEMAGAGEHSITYTLTQNCGGSDSITMVVESHIQARILTDSMHCVPSDSIPLQATESGGSWYFNGAQVLSGSLYASATDAGEHELIYTTAGNCNDSDTVTLHLIPFADADILTDGPFYENEDALQLHANETNGEWEGNGTDDHGIFHPAEAGTGRHQVIYTIPGKCGDSDTVLIEVKSAADAEIVIATVLTPNGDGYNDTWKIEGVNAFEKLDIQVFNRWGDAVFTFTGEGETYTDPANQWDGSYEGKAQPFGNYIFVISADNQTFKGSLSLVR
ncbi:MAG: gliding motility-associated C-terminal domain-containing protein [Bacteroidota bacterium]